jgi:hypothetical protein
LAIVVAVVVVVAAASRGIGGGRVSNAFAACPGHVPSQIRLLHGATRPANLTVAFPPDAVATELCLYDEPFRSHASVAPGAPTLVARKDLDAQTTKVFTRLVRSTASGESCDGGSPVLIRLQTSRGDVRSLSLLAAGCSPEMLRSPGGTGRVDSAILGGLLNPPPVIPEPEIAAPSEIRMPLEQAAERFARWEKVHLLSVPPGGAGELIDRDVPFGTVIWQSPLPGVPQARDLVSASFIVAVTRAPACTTSELRGQYEDNGNLTGGHYGSIVLFDQGARPCTLGGRVTLTGLNARGRPAEGSISEPLRGMLVLSPRATSDQVVHAYGSAIVGTVGFGGGEDQQAVGGCREAIPARWRVRLSTGATVLVPNIPPVVRADPKNGPFFSCVGSLTFQQPGGGALTAS